MEDKQIERLTGMKSKSDFFAMIVVICNGDERTIRGNSVQNLTWFEEWVLFFETLWGRVYQRWEDVAAEYGLSNNNETKIFDEKLRLLVSVRAGWPAFCSLKDEKWECLKKNERCGLTVYTICVKGGVSNQPCGWVRSHHLWSGGISDTMYQETTGILAMQEEFVRNDLQQGKYIAFIMIMDKGYRVTVAAWKRGEQTCIQPIFMESDKIFSTKDLIYTSNIASHRAGNERNVNLAKMNGFIKRGVHPKNNLSRIDDV